MLTAPFTGSQVIQLLSSQVQTAALSGEFPGRRSPSSTALRAEPETGVRAAVSQAVTRVCLSFILHPSVWPHLRASALHSRPARATDSISCPKCLFKPEPRDRQCPATHPTPPLLLGPLGCLCFPALTGLSVTGYLRIMGPAGHVTRHI